VVSGLVERQQVRRPAYSPEEGYHLSEDLVGRRCRLIATRRPAPSKPWFMWLCPGANHAPHHAPKEYIDKYKGKFDAATRPIASGCCRA
jgi:arylsulfatase